MWKVAGGIGGFGVRSVAILSLTMSALLPGLPSFAEDELAAKYGNGKLLDTSLVDQQCLVDKCALQSKECLVDDPSCRKGLTCTAKCMGDNACITGCMARWGNSHLDNLLKCTIEEVRAGGATAGKERRLERSDRYISACANN